MNYSKIILISLWILMIQSICSSLASTPIKVGIYQNRPKLFLDEQGRAAGFFPGLLNYIALKEDWDLKYIPCKWNNCLKMVEKGNLDLMMDVAYSQSRAKRFQFNQEVALGNWSRIYTKPGVSISSILKLDQKKVAVVKGSIQAVRLKKNAKIFGIEPKFIEVESFLQVFSMLENGQADAGVVNRLFGAQQKENFGLQESSVVLGPSKLMFIAPKEKNAQLLEAINKHLVRLKKDPDSIYYTLLDKALEPAKKPIFPQLPLTAKEANWLKGQKEIAIAINRAWPPMDYLDENKQPQGIGVKFIKAMNKRLSGKLKIIPLPWEKMYNQVKAGKMDALMDITPRPEREKYFNFTEPYISVPHVIIASKKGPRYSNLSDLRGKSVGVEKNFFIVNVLKKKYPKIQVRLFKDTSDALDAVAKKEVDAYIGNRAVAMYIIEHELIANLKVHGKIKETASNNAIGVRKDLPVLRDILQKALKDLSKAEKASILKSWSTSYEKDKSERINLTPEEKSWISKHQELRLGYVSNWPPVEYADSKGRFMGMAADYMKLLSKISGIKFIPSSHNEWDKTLAQVKSGQIQVLSAVSRTSRREKFLFFTEPYLRFPMVIVTDQLAPYIGNLNELRGKKVAVGRKFASHDFLKAKYPEIDLLLTDDVLQGLTAVLHGEAQGFIGSLAAVSHVISREGMSKLKVAGETPFNYELCIGISKMQPVLAGILKKALQAVTEQEQNAIYKRWISVKYEQGFNYALLWKVILAAFLILVAILYWNRRLMREVGRRRKAEAELREAKKSAESANQVKSAFLANMSHELRTPLNSIIGFTGIVINEMAGPLNLEQKKQLRMVKGSARHLLNLINDVLDISKIESGEIEFSFEQFNLQELIQQAVGSLKPLAEQKGLELSLDIASEVGMVYSDQRRVRQILINLVNNAIKFTDQGWVKVTCSKSDSYLEIQVSDSGIGIRKEDLEKIFAPFQQVDVGISRKYEGTGLGLSVCKKILEKLGGEMHVQSELDQGSTFSFTLPLNSEVNRDAKKGIDH